MSPARRDIWDRATDESPRCHRKVPYTTKARAVMAAAPHRAQGVPLRAYKCGVCHRWHLTKQPLKATG